MWPYVQFAVFISMMVTLTTFFCSVGTRAKRRRKKKRAKRRKRRRKKRRKGKEETHPHRTPMTTERGWYIWNVLQLPEIWQITSTIKYKLFLSFICIFLLNTSISRSHLIITGFSKFASFYENILKMVPPLVFWTIWRISGWLWNTIFPLSPLEGTKALSYTQHLGSISYIWGSCLTRPQIHPEKQVYRRVGDIPDE